ncbi:hypothetical protein [Saccharospirillum salsuginis]|uniref:Uncharacterized protein n=1 Tax=Saccharospirillum salsuginis TaxID=418750 RepID=A0A918KGJ3_9GAMM|nr:hypothetical protein [Saccharospirillum salsuginis]GGX62834.1 hypothetical protein GCM10007392_33420 [Saccharospirillum salsuginis]
MLDIHITEFYNDMGRILASLYRHFPRQISLYVEDISGPDTPDEYGLHSERHLACFSTFLWLAEEGLIRYGDVERQVAFNHCVLTLDAFRLLSGFDPDGGPKLIDELRLAIQEGSSDMTEDTLRRLLAAHAT